MIFAMISTTGRNPTRRTPLPATLPAGHSQVSRATSTPGADLCRLGGFRDLARDPNGNPVVYEEDGTWIGPEEPELVAMWKDFPDQKPEHEPGLNSRP